MVKTAHKKDSQFRPECQAGSCQIRYQVKFLLNLRCREFIIAPIDYMPILECRNESYPQQHLKPGVFDYPKLRVLPVRHSSAKRISPRPRLRRVKAGARGFEPRSRDLESRSLPIELMPPSSLWLIAYSVWQKTQLGSREVAPNYRPQTMRKMLFSGNSGLFVRSALATPFAIFF